MVSQPSGPLHHRPLPTTWLPVPVRVGASELELRCSTLTPTTFSWAPSIPGVCLCIEGLCVRSRKVKASAGHV